MILIWTMRMIKVTAAQAMAPATMATVETTGTRMAMTIAGTMGTRTATATVPGTETMVPETVGITLTEPITAQMTMVAEAMVVPMIMEMEEAATETVVPEPVMTTELAAAMSVST